MLLTNMDALNAPYDTVWIFLVPSEAGARFPGQSKAPIAILDEAQLGPKLHQAGFKISVTDDIFNAAITKTASWKPSPVINGVRNEDAAEKVLTMIYGMLTMNLMPNDMDYFPLILGGDRSITPAVLPTIVNRQQLSTRIGVIYFDGDVGLTLPSETAADGSSAFLESMTLTHLTRRDGGLDSMKKFARRDGSTLVTNDNIVLFGFDPLRPSPEHWVYLADNGFKTFSRPTVQKRPEESAKAALAWLMDRVDVICLHFDVDAIDAGSFPLANYPHYAGIQHKEAFQALQCFLRSPAVRGMILTGANPNNDPTGKMTAQLVDNIVAGLKKD